MNSGPPSGWSAPNSQAQSLNSSGTSSSGTIPVQRPTKIPINQRSAPLAAAKRGLFSIAEQPTILSSSSSSDIEPFVSTSTREARLASALAIRATALSKYELANANQEVAEAQERALVKSPSGSVARLATCKVKVGVRPERDKDRSQKWPCPPLPLERVA